MNNRDPIRIFIVGGVTGESTESDRRMYNIARSLGNYLGQSANIRIVLCSSHRSSADAAIIEGFARTKGDIPGNVIVHHPLDDRPGLEPGQSILEQWDALIARSGLAKPQMRQNSEARVLDNSGLSNAFLLCQIRALREDTDIVVALGGRRDASAAQLLAIARGHYPIVPFAFLGGAAEQEFLRQEASIRSFIKQQTIMDALQKPEGVSQILELIDTLHRAHGRHHVFMSYSWKRKEEADYVEAYLRRDPRISLFRDEDEIQIGEPISDRIKQQLRKCDAFLVLWCTEYAASPNCYDELQIASKRKDCITYILRLDDTRAVWPVLRKPGSHEWKMKWMPPGAALEKREAIASSLDELLRQLSDC